MTHPLTELPPSRRWRGQTQPVPVVAAVIHRDSRAVDEILLIKRIKPPYAGQWALVGGQWEFGESIAEAVEREVLEETGLSTTFVALLGCASERIEPQQETDMGAHFVIFVCEVTVREGEASEQAEGQVLWFSESQLDALYRQGQIAPTDYRIVEKYLKAPGMQWFVEVEVIAGGGDLTAREIGRWTTIARE